MKALLIFCDVEGRVAIEVPAQVDGSELDDGLGHLLSPAHSRTLHPILDEILAGALDGATGDGPALACTASECEPLELILVEGAAESRRWRERVERYHYLGCAFDPFVWKCVGFGAHKGAT